MMKDYIHKGPDGEFLTVNNCTAFDGFRQMGWEIEFFQHINQLSNLEKEEVVVSHIEDIQKAIAQLNIEIPYFSTYPNDLIPFLGRKIWRSKLSSISGNPDQWNVFIKPFDRLKKFTGVLVKSTKDLIGCGDQFEDTEIWCSEPVHFIREWRCFVRYGQIIDIRPYKGSWKGNYDPIIIENAVNAFQNAPHAYALDFGLTDTGKTLLVEANEGYSLGAYGLFPLDYAKLLSARWAQITGSRDYCDF